MAPVADDFRILREGCRQISEELAHIQDLLEAMMVAERRRAAAVRLQAAARRFVARRRFLAQHQDQAAAVARLQAAARGFLARRLVAKHRAAAVRLQAGALRFLARRHSQGAAATPRLEATADGSLARLPSFLAPTTQHNAGNKRTAAVHLQAPIQSLGARWPQWDSSAGHDLRRTALGVNWQELFPWDPGECRHLPLPLSSTAARGRAGPQGRGRCHGQPTGCATVPRVNSTRATVTAREQYRATVRIRV